MNQPLQTNIVINPQKSTGVALALTFFFGPLGLLYASVPGGIIMLVLTVVVGIFTLGIGAILGWIISMIWAVVAVNSHNKKALAALNQSSSSS